MTFDVRSSSFCVRARRSRFGVHRSGFGVRGSRCEVRGSRFCANVTGSGTARESCRRMAGVRRYEDLEAWQLADELKRDVYALTEEGRAANDFKFRAQIRDSAASSTKNIAEGFGRFNPGDFAHFVEIALASAMETQDSLKDGIDRGYFIPARVAAAQRLAERTIKCSTKFIVYLKREAQRRARKKRARPN